MVANRLVRHRDGIEWAAVDELRLENVSLYFEGNVKFFSPVACFNDLCRIAR